jgi:hypothetical protein
LHCGFRSKADKPGQPGCAVERQEDFLELANQGAYFANVAQNPAEKGQLLKWYF